MNVRVAVCVGSAAIAACVHINPFTGGRGDGGGDGSSDGGGGSGNGSVIVTGSGSSATVTAPGLYTMTFGSGGYHFPTSWIYGGDELLAHDGTGCADELDVGLAITPAGQVSGLGSSGSFTVLPSLIHELDGPYVSKLGIDWESHFPGAATPYIDVGKKTTFTFFPDGRITRYDHMLDSSSSADATMTHCSGASSSRWYIASYWTLQSALFPSLSHGSPPTDTSLAGVDPNSSVECAYGSKHHIAFGWPDPNSRVRMPATGDISFLYDFVTSATNPLGSIEKYATTTVLVDDNPDCAALEQRMMPYNDGSPPQLVVNGNPIGPADDGIYGGSQQDGAGGMGPLSGTSPITVAPQGSIPVPGGFALWVAFDSKHTTFDIQPSTAVVRSEPTVQNPNATVFWFPNPLMPGEQITITPQ